MPVISAVVVSYRSGALAARALAGMRRDAQASGLPLETIAVVNSGDPDEARVLREAADDVVLAGRNLGYAGGLNAGLSKARGETLLLSNPDVDLRPGALRALAEAARPGVMAGPAFFLDEGETLHLPPGEEPGLASLARRRVGAGSPRVFRRSVRRAVRAAHEAERGEAAAVTALSGALLAVSRATFDRVGPFDEAYALYYEENDWQRRLRLSGGSLLRVGSARVVHAYNRSARLEPQAAAWFAASERRYFTTHFGARGRQALDAALAQPPHVSASALETPREVLLLPRAAAVALSPVPDFASFAFAPRASAGAWRPPGDVREGFGGATWHARAVDLDTFEILAEAALC